MILVAAGLAAALGATPAAQGQTKAPPVFGIEVENVFIDAFVSRRGAPVLNLTAGDFELRDNGVVQQLELVASDTQPLQAVLAFDTSGSLSAAEVSSLRAASEALLETLRPEDEATLFTFSDTIQWTSPPTTEKKSVHRALETVPSGGGTAIMDALYAALLLPKFRGRSLVVLFTDGNDNQSWLDWGQIKVVAQRSNAVIHIVSLRYEGTRADDSEQPLYQNTWALRQIADLTGGQYWEAESLPRLKEAFAAIAEAMGKRYVLRYAPENVTRPGWHKIELKLKDKKGDVRTRSGYWVAQRTP